MRIFLIRWHEVKLQKVGEAGPAVERVSGARPRVVLDRDQSFVFLVGFALDQI